MADYFRPENLNDALAILARQRCRILAGGTDIYPALGNTMARPGNDPGQPAAAALPMLDISAIAVLHGFRHSHDTLEIGAMTRWSEASAADLPAWFDGVRLAAREIGGRQIQNRATLTGNLCNASPAADGVPALLALDARVRLQSAGGQRELSLDRFILGNRRTACRTDELVSTIVIPKPAGHSCSAFVKLGARRYLVISIAMVALTLQLDEHNRISQAGVAVGACSEVAQRLPELEQRLTGMPLPRAVAAIRQDDFKRLSPLDDIRASAAYRRHSARVLVERALQQLAQTAGAQAA